MPKCQPPIEHQFKKGNPSGGNRGHKGPYLLPLIKKFLEKKINYEDPETRKKIRGNVKDAVIWRLILNATEGETNAIKEILERTDGKVEQKNLNEMSGTVTVMGRVLVDGKPLDLDKVG